MEFIGGFTHLTDTTLCAVLTGYLTSYVITLGSCYTYMLRNDRVKELQTGYVPLRTNSNTKALYRICFAPQVVFATVSLLLSHSTHPPPVQVYALAVLPTFLTVYVVAGFGKIEERMTSRKELMEPEIDLYTKLNLPLYPVYAALYLIDATQLITALL